MNAEELIQRFSALSTAERQKFLTSIPSQLTSLDLFYLRNSIISTHHSNLESIDLFTCLPREISSHVIRYLSIYDVLNLRLVSRRWWNVIEDEEVWRELLNSYQNDFEQIHSGSVNESRKDYFKECVLKLHRQSLNWTVPYVHSLPVYYLKSHHEKLTCLKLEKSVLATCGYDRTVRVWLWKRGSPKMWRLWWKYSVDFVASCIDFVLKNGKLIIAVGGYNRRLLIFSRSIPTPDHPPSPSSKVHLNIVTTNSILAISLTDSYVALATSDNIVSVYHYPTSTPIRVMQMHTGKIVNVKIDGTILVSAGYDCALLVHRLPRVIDTGTPETNQAKFQGNFGVNQPILAMDYKYSIVTFVTNDGIWLHQLVEPPSIPNVPPRIAPGAKPTYFPIPNPKSKIALTRHNIVMAGVREIVIYKWSKSKQTCIDNDGQVKVEYVYELPYAELWNATRSLDSTTIESAEGDSKNGCTVLKPSFISGRQFSGFRISTDTKSSVGSELGPSSHQQGIGIFESDVVNDSGNNWIGMNICGLDADEKWVIVGCGDGGVRGWEFGVD